jgi:imidazoleglycerol-phosphate dehydratase/histidinol-phosphatase
MSTADKILFIDRDGTLIEEPPDEQIDSYAKLRLLPGVIPALLRLRDAGFRFVMVTNQDGLGTPSLPTANFQGPHDLLMQILESQGVPFEAVLICPHKPADGCDCRKPQPKLVEDWLVGRNVDRARSAVIGDRDTDMQLAQNLGMRAFRIRTGSPDEAWPAVADALTQSRRTARVARRTRETDIVVEVDLDRESPIQVATGIGFFDHMLEQVARHGGFSLVLSCHGDLQVDEHHTVEDCALALGAVLRQALGDKLGIARYGFLLPMDEAEAKVALDLSGRALFRFEGRFGRDRVGELPTELVPHFFHSLADALGCALHIAVTGDNTHHMVEACFKGVGRTLRQAFRVEGRELPSSKGVL